MTGRTTARLSRVEVHTIMKEFEKTIACGDFFRSAINIKGRKNLE